MKQINNLFVCERYIKVAIHVVCYTFLAITIVLLLMSGIFWLPAVIVAVTGLTLFICAKLRRKASSIEEGCIKDLGEEEYLQRCLQSRYRKRYDNKVYRVLTCIVALLLMANIIYTFYTPDARKLNIEFKAAVETVKKSDVAIPFAAELSAMSAVLPTVLKELICCGADVIDLSQEGLDAAEAYIAGELAESDFNRLIAEEQVKVDGVNQFLRLEAPLRCILFIIAVVTVRRAHYLGSLIPLSWLTYKINEKKVREYLTRKA